MAQCTATAKGSGEPCRRQAHPGTIVCVKHGAAAPQVKAKAAERVAEAALRRHLETLQVTPVDDPLTQLALVAGEVLAWKDLLAVKVADLGGQLRRESRDGTEQLRAEVALFEKSLDRCERFLSAMARHNIDERLARITETQADSIIAVIDGVLTDMGVDPEEARPHVTRRLELVAGGGA